MPESNPSLETLNAVQEVLRHLMLSLATASKADPGQLAKLLALSAQDPDLAQTAQAMLQDPADGAQVLAHMAGQRQTDD